MGSVSPIPRIVVRGVQGVGPLSLDLLRSQLLAGWGFVSYPLWLYGLRFWGLHHPPWVGGGLNSELTLPVWATGWRRLLGLV